ncbi:gibberellin-regulated protein 6-like [Dioscorea cayenensis subsp. rotundata]|uniref:Gibberellin-regulated protein 6-like n=1 Tax=Dioscorea cayennensis subsp. rotundata TaxID=55577 RepID=A0AB40AJ42_DIOCR|nr:gibberellin-regulated protein 6-like [Dioscorea cayenensis subsp. rotundata]
MAKLLSCLLLLLLLLISVSLISCHVDHDMNQMLAKHTQKGKHYGAGSLKSYQCPRECTRRCSRTQYHKPCMFFCQKCCRKCLCVPPGYYGNKQVCGCYNNWKTKRGGPKCP